MNAPSRSNSATQHEVATISTRTVYENPWMRVREDVIGRADGSTGIYGVVEKSDFAVVIAVEGGRIWLVEQYRHPVGIRCWELPQGSSERDPLAPAIEIARHELREEVGLVAEQLVSIGCLHHGYGYSTQRMHVVLATGLTLVGGEPEPTELDLVAANVPIEQFERMIRAGEITDASTVAAWSLYRMSA